MEKLEITLLGLSLDNNENISNTNENISNTNENISNTNENISNTNENISNTNENISNTNEIINIYIKEVIIKKIKECKVNELFKLNEGIGLSIYKALDTKLINNSTNKLIHKLKKKIKKN